jgi:hypothetical protein
MTGRSVAGEMTRFFNEPKEFVQVVFATHQVLPYIELLSPGKPRLCDPQRRAAMTSVPGSNSKMQAGEGKPMLGLSWLGLLKGLALILCIVGIVSCALAYFIPAPPTTVTIATAF